MNADERRCKKAGPLAIHTPLRLFATIVFLLFTLLVSHGAAEDGRPRGYALRLTITSALPLGNVPMDPTIDFGAIIAGENLPGVLDPNSIEVVNLGTGERVAAVVTEDFAYSDKGRVEWLVPDPSHREYEIRFRTAAARPALRPAEYTPLVGVGDLLRYNAGAPRPIAPIYLSGLIDVTGDGKRDLIGCWNYAYRPGWPWDGIICFPRVGQAERFEFGDLVRLRYLDDAASTELRHFSTIYMCADVADLNGDGLMDVVYSPRGGERVFFYLGSHQHRRDAGATGGSGDSDATGGSGAKRARSATRFGGAPAFVAAGSVGRGGADWNPVRAVDLNGDGAMDLVVGNSYLRNTNARGWPIQPADAVALDAGRDACFFDVDGDGALDSVCLVDGPAEEPRAARVAWRRNVGGDPPRFAAAEVLDDIDVFWAGSLAAVTDGPPRGLMVQHDVFQRVAFFEQLADEGGKPCFRRAGAAGSRSAVLALSDQAWPCVCDWDGDGDWDLLVGGGYGWPRIVINEGSSERPAFGEAQLILADGEPIRILRDEVLGGKHWHNMGYPYPDYVDWDGDDLPDLMLPNETNRIFWYKNVGTRRVPKFGKRQQVICDGYPDAPEQRAKSARLAADANVPNNPYPYEEDRPFFWRTGAAFADFNGDGFMDMVTHDGYTRKATLFAQYRDHGGVLRLRKDRTLKLVDGREIDDAIVNRQAHWTESFRAGDWDGDGLIDLFYNCAGAHGGIQDGGSIFLLRNCGTKGEPVFEAPVTMRCFGEPIRITNHGPNAWPADVDGDGKLDLVACVEWSVYPLYRHAALVMPERPEYEIDVQPDSTSRRSDNDQGER